MHLNESDINRFFSKVDKTDGCWEWTASLNTYGYGQFWINDLKRNEGAHVVSFFIKNGTINKELCLDHLCRNRKCVNPDHLEEVTTRENNLRGESPFAKYSRAKLCFRGHALEGDNVRQSEFLKKGHRICKECNRINFHLRKGNPIPKRRSWQVRLSDNDVFEIKKLLEGGHTQKSIASVFKVHQSSISHLKSSERFYVAE